MNKQKKLVSILAGIMAAVMLLTLILSLFPAKASALSSKEIKKQINALKQQNKDLEKQIEDIQAQYGENEDEIANLVNRKYAIDQEISILYEQIENIGQQLTAFGLLIADSQDDLDAAQDRLEELSLKNKERIRAMEEDGSVSYWSVLFKAKSFSDLLDRLNMIEEIAASDQRRLKEMSEAAELVAQAKDVLQGEKDELQTTKDELDAAQAQLNQKKEEAQQLLNELIQKGYELENLYDQYELEKQQLLDEIAQKEAEYELQKELEWIAYMATYTEPTTAPPATQKPTTGNNSGGNQNSGSGTDGAGNNGSQDSTQPPEETTKPTEPPASSGESWIVPCTYRQLSSPFGERESPTAGASSNHQGIDLAGPEGTPIYATRSGVVTVNKSSKSAGNYVTIKHDNTYSSIYMHLSRSVVKKGQTVKQGELIGYMGSTGIVTGTHLHFGIIKNGTYVNPANYMYFHP